MAKRADQLELVFESLRSGTDEQAASLLACLRRGVDVENLATSLETSTSITAETLLAGYLAIILHVQWYKAITNANIS